jgi:anthranilate phosphoribosyltransferase
MIARILTSARYARVLRLLDLERKLVLNGPLSGLKAVVEQRETAVAEILERESELPEAFLMALKARAERNSRLILASLAGVRSGLARIQQIASERSELRTYTAGGAPVAVRAPEITRDHRS